MATDVVAAPDFSFDIGTRRIYSLNGPAGRADRIDVTFGDNPLLIKFLQNGDDAQLPATTALRFAVKPLRDYAGASYFDASVASLGVAASQVSIGENWSDIDLLGLLTIGKDYVDLSGLLSVKLPADTLPRMARPFTVRLWNSIFAVEAGAVSPVQFVKVYRALLTQAGAGAPVATVLENSLGTIVWSRTVAGEYAGTLAGAFPVAKTFVFMSAPNASTAYAYADSVNQIIIEAGADDTISQASIEIRVYP